MFLLIEKLERDVLVCRATHSTENDVAMIDFYYLLILFSQ